MWVVVDSYKHKGFCGSIQTRIDFDSYKHEGSCRNIQTWVDDDYTQENYAFKHGGSCGFIHCGVVVDS